MKTFRNLAIAATVAGAAALPAFAHAATVTLPSVSASGNIAANILGLIGAALGFSVSA